VEFFHQNEYVRSYSIYKHDTTLKMAFGAFFFYNFNTGPPTHVVTIAPIDDPRARDTVMLTLAITISSYRYSTSTAISKGCGEQPCVPRLTSYSKAPLRLSLTQRPVTAKTYVLGKSTDSYFAYPLESPESAIKAQQP